MGSARPRPDKPQRLPRGRHRLDRAQVVEVQRERVLKAMVAVVAELGYSQTRIVDVIKAAGVSRKTFYELFDDKEDCFLAAYDEALAALYEQTELAFARTAELPWAERIRRGLAAFLRMVASQPEAARFCIVEALAAGPKALARRDAAVRQFTTFIEAGRAETHTELPGITALSLAGGLNELLYSEILSGAGAKLHGRLPEVVFWITQPFLGADRAEEERRLAELMLADGAGTA